MSKDKVSRQTLFRVAAALGAAALAVALAAAIATPGQAQVRVTSLPQAQSVVVTQAPASRATITAIVTSFSKVAASTQVAGAKVVTVAPGDSLSRIAQRHCGAQGYWPGLWQANKGTVSNPDRIYPGQQLTVSCVRTNARASRSSARSSSTAPAVAAATGAWVHPLASGKRGGSCWGAARSGHSHQGVDMSQPSGTTIRAVHAGTVVLSRWVNGGGNTVAVDHGNGTQSVYMHMVAPGVRVGTKVQAGSAIGRVGSTGNSTGPHLHFEIHRGLWSRVNPAPFMRQHGVDIGC